ncbi:chloride channel protein [Nocardioides sp. MAHUQ-72]|uniref:chloride channel protein n=1 Tax=unclassified Nocardioides TaxID=2615069 RepID=UPI00361EB33A
MDTQGTQTAAPAGAATPDPFALLRSRGYVGLLVLGALVGVPVAVVAYFFLALVTKAQHWVFDSLPDALGLDSSPIWWPVVPLVLCGLVVGLTLRYLHGTGGHRPAEGFKASGATDPRDLPGIALASLATLCLGAVLGPEAPLIAIGSGLGVLAVRLLKKDAPQSAVGVIAAAGSFAAIATLLGSPITGAFLLMEAAGLAGTMMGVVLLPGLLAAGIGALIFVGLDGWTGLGTFSLAIPDLPTASAPTVSEFLWAIAIGLVAAFLGLLIRRGALALQPVVERRQVLLTPVVGLGVALVAVAFEAATDRDASYVLFSGQDALPDLVREASSWSAGALVLLVVCKGLAYSLSLSCFRGGPVFPAMFVGAALGILAAELPGLSTLAGVGIGIGAMTVAMLRLPLVSVLLPSLLLVSDAVALMPLVIVGVVTSYVASAWLTPPVTSAEAP